MISLSTDPLPLTLDAHGTIRVGQTRGPLDFVVEAFQLGYSPEEIAARFPTLQLPDVYVALGYYLRHQSEIDTYLTERAQQSAQLRAEFDAWR